MLKDEIIKNGGATINKKGEIVTLKSGYQLSTKNLGRVNVADFTEKMVQDIVAYGLKRGEYAGFWIDDGFVYCDISRRVAVKKVALELGRKLGELAVYDWKKSGCVACA